MVASSNPALQGWVKYFLDPPYDKPTNVTEVSPELWAQWMDLIHRDPNRNSIVAEGPTLVIYDSALNRHAGPFKGRIVVAVKK